jgi:chemotaxis signal transduction protein
MVSTSTTSETRSFLRCDAGDRAFFFAEDRVLDVLDASRISLEGSDDSTCLSTDSGPIPAYRLDSLFEKGATAPSQPILFALIVAEAEHRCAILLDSAPVAQEVRSEQVTAVPRIVLASGSIHVEAVVQLATVGDWLSAGFLLSADRPASNTEPQTETPFEWGRQPTSSATGSRSKLVSLSLIPRDSEVPEFPRVGLLTSQIIEVIESRPILQLPGGKPGLMGFIRWRKLALPVIDLGLHLGLPAASSEEANRLVIVRGQDLFAFPICSSVRRIQNLKSAVPLAAPAGIEPDRIRGTFRWDDDVVIMPDLRSLPTFDRSGLEESPQYAEMSSFRAQ